MARFRLFKIPAENPPVPMAVAYDLPEGFDLEGSITEGQYPGLLGFHLLYSTGELPERRLYCYWASRDSFLTAKPQLEKALGLKAPSYEGLVTEHLPRPSLFKRISLNALIIGLAATLGALEVIGNRYDWLFERPRLWPRLERSEPLRYITGDNFEEELLLSTSSPIDLKDISFDKKALFPEYPGEPVELSSDPSSLPRLSKGETATVRFQGVAPPAGKYGFEISISAKAGLFRKRRSFPMIRSVEVWPNEPELTLVFDRIDGHRIFLSGRFRIPRTVTEGLRCQAEFLNAPRSKLVLLNVRGKENARTMWDDPGGESILVVTWEMEAIRESFKALPTTLVVETELPEEWSAVPKQTSAYCSKKESTE